MSGRVCVAYLLCPPPPKTPPKIFMAHQLRDATNKGPRRFAGRSSRRGTHFGLGCIGLTTWFREYKPVSPRARASSPRAGPLSEAPARDHDQYQPPLGGTFLSAEGERRAVFAQAGAGRPPARPEYLYGARRRAPASSPAPVAPEKAIPAVGHATQPQIARSAVLHAETAKISSRPLHPPRRIHEARPLAAHKRP